MFTVIYYKRFNTWGVLDDNRIYTIRKTFQEVNAVIYHLTGELFPYDYKEWPVR